MGSAASDSKSSQISTSTSSSSSKSYGRIKKFYRNEELLDQGLRLHTHNSDRLYRWAMWRMYLNEEMSRAITAQQDFNDQSVSISGITSSYTEYPDGHKYGRLMRTLSEHGDSVIDDAVTRRNLPDNVYLVYGIPRVSLCRGPSKEVRELHNSMVDLARTHLVDEDSNVKERTDTDKHITELFDFVASDITQSESQISNERRESIKLEVGVHNSYTSNKTGETRYTDVHQSGTETGNDAVKVESGIPAVSKSRQFWEKLATKRAEIINTAKENEKQGSGNAISDDILLKQRTLLKKTLPRQKTSKDHWKSLSERKTEILQLREMNGEPIGPKKHESKSGHLWNLLFSKKKELVQIKNNSKNTTEQAQTSKADFTPKQVKVIEKPVESDCVPVNFEDSFQTELANKLKKRRQTQDGTLIPPSSDL